MTHALRLVGRQTLVILSDVGGLSVLAGRFVLGLPDFFRRFRLTTNQMLAIGVNSLPLILITSTFVGAVSAWQAAYQFKGYVPLRYLGATVGKAVFIELGPVLTALVVAGRVGASIAAELGTMKVTEQIDALETLAVDPVRYLVVPRIVAGITMLPLLTIFSDAIAIAGALVVSVLFVDLSSETFLNSLKLFFSSSDLFSGLFKAAVFGGIIGLVGCYHGLQAEGGAEGVGRSTTRAVVTASVLILISDYVVATILFSI